MKFVKNGDWYEVMDGDKSLGYVEKSISRLSKSSVWKIFSSEGKPIKVQMGNIFEQRGYRKRGDAVEALEQYNKTEVITSD